MSDMDLTPAEGWRPDPGAVLIGKVIRVDAAHSDYIGGMYPLIVVAREPDGQNIAVHCFHDILRNRMLLLRPKTGERIGIKYHGKKDSRDGLRTISQYTVKIDGRDADADLWDAMTPAGRGQAQPTPQQPPQQPLLTTQEHVAAATSGADPVVYDDDIPF